MWFWYTAKTVVQHISGVSHSALRNKKNMVTTNTSNNENNKIISITIPSMLLYVLMLVGVLYKWSLPSTL